MLRGKDWASLGIVTALGLLAPMAINLWPAPPRSLGPSQGLPAALQDQGSPSVGPRDATVTVIVFSDYQCANCRANYPAVERVRREFPEVRFIYKDWPIFGVRSEYASRVALAADRQGRFLALHDALMRTSGPLDEAAVRSVAERVGVNWSALADDLISNGPALASQLKRHGFEAWTLGVEGTPAYVVGDKVYEGRTSEGVLKKAIRESKSRAARIPS